MSLLDITKVRSSFPALSSKSKFSTNGVPFIFADNAGGSQILSSVVLKISDYLVNTNAQFGADYPVSQAATKRVFEDAQESARVMFGFDEGEGEVVWGSSTTQSFESLARSMELGGKIKAGDEIIITGEHEGEFIIHIYIHISHVDHPYLTDLVIIQPTSAHGKNSLPVSVLPSNYGLTLLYPPLLANPIPFPSH
jgi:selenocysteine lyase/cysteine desulfurase